MLRTNQNQRKKEPIVITITVKYGLRTLSNIEVANGSSVRDVMNNTAVKAGLGLSENLRAVVDGRTLENGDTIFGGDTVIFEKQAASKA
jgi:hypothetical protein